MKPKFIRRVAMLVIQQIIAPVVLVAAVAGPSLAAPPGDLPFGVYDPDGLFADDTEVTIEHLFMPWQDVFLPGLIDADEYALERGRSVLVTIEPWTWNRSERNTAGHLLAGITSGSYDKYMASICAVLDLFESPVTIRWAQEMEDESGQFIWADWEPQAYVSAYRRMVDICRANAPELAYMWSPLGFDDLADYYPGDDYVDVVGLSVFGLQAWEREILGGEQTFVDVLEPRYEAAVVLGKPIVVAELGYVGDADYVAQWESDVRRIHPQFPSLVAVLYFNQVEVYPWPDGHGFPNWRTEAHILEE